MWDLEMATNTLSMFLKGKLFKDMKQFLRQSAIGIVATALFMLVLGFAGVKPLIAAAVAGFVGGTLQPYLFKDLKYH